MDSGLCSNSFARMCLNVNSRPGYLICWWYMLASHIITLSNVMYFRLYNYGIF